MVPQLRIGGALRNSFDLERTYTLTREYTNWVGRLQSENYSESGTIDWPLSAGLGAAIIPTDALTLSADYTRSLWSEASYRFSSSTVQAVNTSRSVVDTSGTVLYPQMFDPARPVQPYFNVPQRDGSQLRIGGDFVWHRFDRGGLSGIPLRAGLYGNQLPIPQSDGTRLAGIGVTAGTGIRWRRLSVDVAYIRESASGKTRDFPVTTFPGFSEAQQEVGKETTVLHRLAVSAEARF